MGLKAAWKALWSSKNNPSAVPEGPTFEQKSEIYSSYAKYLLGSHLGYGMRITPNFAYFLWESNETIGDAVDRIAWAFEQMNPVLKDKITGEFLVNENDHPALKLINNPGQITTRSNLFYELMTSFLLTGECYPVLIGNVRFEPSAIYQIPANKAEPIEGPSGWADAIQFTANYNQKLYTRQIIPNKNTWVYHSRDQLSETTQIYIVKQRYGVRGLSILNRIIYQALTKYYGAIHNSSLMQRGSRPGGLWSPKNDGFSQTQYEAFKKEVETYFTGPVEAGRNIVAPTPVQYEDFLKNPRDMDFVNLFNVFGKEIYSQFQIPLALVVTDTMTFRNYEKAVEALYDFAVLPRAKFLYNILGNFVLQRYKDGDRFELTVNEKQLPALKERLFKRAESMRKSYAFSEDEIRNETGHESLGEEGNRVWKPSTLVPSGEEDEYTEDVIRIREGENE